MGKISKWCFCLIALLLIPVSNCFCCDLQAESAHDCCDSEKSAPEECCPTCLNITSKQQLILPAEIKTQNSYFPQKYDLSAGSPRIRPALLHSNGNSNFTDKSNLILTTVLSEAKARAPPYGC